MNGIQFAHSVRWAPTVAQGAASVAASAGPAAAIMAIYIQLTGISDLVEKNLVEKISPSPGRYVTRRPEPGEGRRGRRLTKRNFEGVGRTR